MNLKNKYDKLVHNGFSDFPKDAVNAYIYIRVDEDSYSVSVEGLSETLIDGLVGLMQKEETMRTLFTVATARNENTDNRDMN